MLFDVDKLVIKKWRYLPFLVARIVKIPLQVNALVTHTEVSVLLSPCYSWFVLNLQVVN